MTKRILLLIMLGCVCGCGRIGQVHRLDDIAYTNNSSDFRVYVEEYGVPVPYLVLDDNYYGNCLLVRECVLDDEVQYNRNYNYSAMYAFSNLDTYLNDTFLDRFNDKLKSSIVTTDIPVFEAKSLGVSGTDMTKITRQVFVLSLSEISEHTMPDTAYKEQHLSYFKSKSARLARCDNGTTAGYWTRTPNTQDTDMLYSVDEFGAVQFLETGNAYGVRPAFCLSGQTVIKYADGEYFISP